MKPQVHLAKYGYTETTLCRLLLRSMPSHEVVVAPHDDTCNACLDEREKLSTSRVFGTAMLVGFAERA